MIISDLSIKRPVFAAVLMLSLVTLGIFSYRRLSVEMFPNVEVPVISIITRYPGASPETVEREVSKQIEEAVNQVAGVKHVMSFSREGVSTVVAEFRLEEKLNDVAQEARAKISSIRGQMPDDIEEPILQKLDFNAMPVASLAVRSEALPVRDLTVLVEKKIKKRFESIAGVGKVDMVGGRKREVGVDIDPARLEALGLGVNDLVSGLVAENTNTPLGRLTHGTSEYPLRIEGKPEKIADYQTMVIARKNGRPVTLAEVAQIRDGSEEKRRLALVNGQPAIGLDIYKQSGANQVQVVDAIKKAMAKVAEELPPGVSLSLVRDGSIMTRESLADVQETLVIGGILTVLIVFCFINSWRSTVITGVTLPISVISSFIVMNAMGMTLNVMTLMALSLAIGLLIDDAIVVRENIVRHLEHGKDHMEASRFGTAEIGLAVFATTMSVIAVFVPVAYMRGIVGRFFFPFGVTVSFAVLVSLLVSFTLDPMLSSRWHDPSIGAHGRRRGLARLLESFNDWFDRTADRYRSAIGWALSHRKTVLFSALAAFAGGIMIFGTLESSFMTTEDKAEFQVSFKTAPDAGIDETENRMAAVLDALGGITEIDHTYATIGAGDSGTVRDGLLYIKLTEKKERQRSQQEIQREVRQRLEKIAGITFSIEIVGNMGSAAKPLNADLKGDDLAVLKDLAARLKDELYTVPGIVDIAATLEHDIPEYRLMVDRERALAAGMNSNDIVIALSRLVGGEAVTSYEDEDGDAVDVRVRLPEALRTDPGQLRNLKITVADGTGRVRFLPLSALTRIEAANTPSEINRRDLSRLVTVSANLDNLPIGTAVKKVEAAVGKIQMPPGYSVNYSGEAEDMAESFAYMGESLILAVVFVYLILAAQFESFLEPFAIMLSLPLSIVGMAGMLKLTGDTINIMSLIGLIMLMGLVTKNAILLVDYAKVLQERDGMPRREAVIQAGRVRLRPIVMTTLAMIFGMLPLFFALGSGAEMRAPMARAVVGGLLTSSLLTLLVVPVMYTCMDDLGQWLKRRWRKGRGGAPVATLILAMGLCFMNGSPLQAAEPRILTLDQAMALADSANHDIQRAREFVRQVEGKYVEERAAALPHLTLTGQMSRQQDKSLGLSGAGAEISRDSQSLEVGLSQPLYTWGKVGAAIRAAEKGFLTADEEIRLVRQSTRLAVAAAFHDILLAREEEAIARQNLVRKEAHLDEASRRRDAGVATDYDVLAARVAVDNAKPLVIRAENRIRTGRDRLRFLLGVTDDVDACGTLEDSDRPLPSHDEALAIAFAQRPEIRSLRHRQEIYGELVTIAQAEDKPRLDLAAGYGQRRLEAGDAADSGPAWNASIVLSFPFFDGMKTRGKVLQAESEQRGLKIAEKRLKEEIALEIRNSVNLARETGEIVAGLAGMVEQAGELLAMAENGFRLGVKTRLEVEDAGLNLMQAKGDLARARRDRLVALVSLDRAMGVLGEGEKPQAE